MADYAVACDTDPLTADPEARVWRCPDCETGVLLPGDLVSPHFVGRVLGCSECAYWEAV